MEGLGDSSSGLSTSLLSSEDESRYRVRFGLAEERLGDFTDDDDVLFFFWLPSSLRLSLAFRFLDSNSFSIRSASFESLSDGSSKSLSSTREFTDDDDVLFIFGSPVPCDSLCHFFFWTAFSSLYVHHLSRCQTDLQNRSLRQVIQLQRAYRRGSCGYLFCFL